MRSRGRFLALLTALGGAAGVSGACTETIPLPGEVTVGDDASGPVTTPTDDAASEPDAGVVADAGGSADVGPSAARDGGNGTCEKVWVKQPFDLQRPQLVIAFD